MKYIPITKGKFAIVDDEDYSKLSQYKWCYNNGYAYKRLGYKQISMQRFIMNPPIGLEVDHINRNRLDNRRSNLRICTRKENLKNRATWRLGRAKQKRKNQYVMRGVINRKTYWQASVYSTEGRKYIGNFKNIHHAALAHDLWEVFLFPDNPLTNFKVVSHN